MKLARLSILCVAVALLDSCSSGYGVLIVAEDKVQTLRRPWCTGVCTTYATEIELAYEYKAPDADVLAMRQAEARAWKAMRAGDWSTANHEIGEMECAASGARLPRGKKVGISPRA